MGKKFQILALSGGGYRGLFTAHVLELLEEEFGGHVADRFDLISGTSIGGILALGLACRIPAKKLKQLFLVHGRDIFRPASRFPCAGWNSSKYDNRPLHRLLASEEFLGARLLGDSTSRLLIPAVNYSSGAPQLFKTPHHENFRSDYRHRMVDIALATSAAPVFFPAYEFNSQQYVDGGLIANAPGLLAVHEAHHFLGRDYDDINVMSIGTVTSQVTANPTTKLNRGAKQWGAKLFELTISAQESLSKFMLQHLLGDRYCDVDVLVTEDQSASVGFNITTEAANKVLIGRANHKTQQFFGQSSFRAYFEHAPEAATFFHGPHRNAPGASNA